MTTNPSFHRNQRWLNEAWRIRAMRKQPPQPPAPQPVRMDQRSANPLRPHQFDQIVGQEPAKQLMHAAVLSTARTGEPVPHTLLTGSAGTGKSTFAHVLGNELGVDVYQVAAPVSLDTLLALREVMAARDVLFVDEIHMQAVMERRGKEAVTQPEVFLSMMEDRVVLTHDGPRPFPAITVIGATTDPGRLPEAFLGRFTLRPRLVDYTDADLGVIAVRNAQALGLTATQDGCVAVALASAGTPRQVNNLVRQAKMFGDTLDKRTVDLVLQATGITADGLTPEQQKMLTFLLRFGGQSTRDGTVYQASVGSLATVLGLSRDVKAVQLYVEPLLIKRGYIQVRPQGRRLTELGERRARQLL